MASVYVGRALSAQEELFISAVMNNYPDNQVTRIEALHTADFSDPEDVPGGIVMLHPPSAKVHPDSLPLNAFSYLAICPIVSKTPLKDSDFKGKEALLHEACPQFSAKPPSLTCRSIDGALDGKTWNAEMGEDENAFVGVFKQTKGRETRYFVAAQAGAPKAAKELRQRLLKKQLTFEELLVDKDYNYAQYIAQRNCQRLAYNAARALRVPIRTMTDMGAHAEQEFSARPKQAVPAYMQAISTIQPVGKQVGVFNRVTPVENNAALQFVYEGPYNGIAVFHMRGKGRGLALPASSGRVLNASALSTQEVSKRCTDVIIEGCATPAERGLHPDLSTDSFRAVDSEEFYEEMKQLGWKQQSNMANMVPVVLKIFNPELKRV